MSERTTFLTVMTGLSIILALRAALSPSVLCQILCCGTARRHVSAKITNTIYQKKYSQKD